ncbi:MAG: hypothetical protein IPL65_06450 [Lewinellaceae bacterium]|nr:hypothetical protein [Lewinellaceae bacterium]
MSIFERLFGKGQAQELQPEIPFGRYTDAYKSKAQLAAWDLAVDFFEQGRSMQAYRELLQYLRDEREDNLHWHNEGDVLHFEFRQGSRKVMGTASAQKLRAESRIAKGDDLNVGVLRRLMEYNFTLKFCRFGLTQDNCLIIQFDTDTTDGTPLKVLHALRELAITADKQDDLLLNEFGGLQPAEQQVEADIPQPEKEAKYQFMRTEIERAFETLDAGKPDSNQFPGGYAYLLLALAFRLDYLLRPEGFMMDVLEKIHGSYFAQNDKNVHQKLLYLRKEFEKLYQRPPEDVFKEMYRTKSTFGINPPVHHDRIKSLIEGELPNMDWHLNQNHEALALAVPKYIAGYALFHFAPPKPDRELLHLFFQIMEADFFHSLGFQLDLLDAQGDPDKKAVIRAIKQVTEKNQAAYPKMRPDTSKLLFDSPVRFAKSYLEMIKELDLTCKE